MERPIRVLVVDDAALMREMLSDMLNDSPGIVVVGKARDGQDAIRKVAELRPDVITLDVQMPGIGGIETLEAILAEHPIPVIMVSALTQRAAEITWQALECGALDYVPKPQTKLETDGPFREELIRKVRAMAGADVVRLLRIRNAHVSKASARTALRRDAQCSAAAEASNNFTDCCVAIGISTGGPPALSVLFQSLTPPLPPIVVVQHMPSTFTAPFACRLDSISRLSIKQAETGDLLQPNQVLIAPGGRHLHLRRQGSRVTAEISDSDPVSGHRPSVDVMMVDAAAVFGARCLGVIMTGMGHDGAAGCAAIRQAGGYVLGQDAATSDVYGMNRVAYVNGAVDRQFALNDLPLLLTRQAAQQFGSKRGIVAATV